MVTRNKSLFQEPTFPSGGERIVTFLFMLLFDKRKKLRILFIFLMSLFKYLHVVRVSCDKNTIHVYVLYQKKKEISDPEHERIWYI